jgi:PAS domain S-box-containing protein
MDKKTIVRTMVKQHRNLQKDLGVINDLLTAGGPIDFRKILELLEQFKKDLVEHLELENGTFYPELLQRMKAKQQNTEKTEQFIAEMKNIEKAVLAFLEKYKDISKEIYNHLETTAESRVNHVETYLEQNIERLKLITSRTKLRNILKSYNQFANEEDKNTINKIITDAKEPIKEIERICIIGLDGIIITSTDDSFCGKDVKNKEFFIQGRQKNKAWLIQKNEETNLFTSGPLILDDEVLGVGIAVVKIDVLNDIITEYTGLGETGEIYLIDKTGLMLTPSRFKKGLAFKQQVNSINANNCLEIGPMNPEKRKMIHDKKGHTDVFPDYRGIDVLGTHAYLSSMQWCLLAEIDAKEALVSTTNILWAYLSLAVVVFFVYYLFAWQLSKNISRPIEILRRGAEIIEKGSLDHKVGIQTKDEIGALSRAFDKMNMAIKQSRTNIDKKVKNQTKEIHQQKTSLEERQKAMLNILEDVEEEKGKVSKERNKINAILHSIGDGVFVVDNNLKITMFNQIAANISGFSIQEAIGQKYDQVLKFVYEKNNQVNDKFIKEAMATGEIKEMANHTLLIRKNGSKIAVADSAAPLLRKDKKVIGCVVVFRNATKEREVDRMKTEFISLASHQLRTPLSAMKWFGEMLLNGDAGKLNKEQQDFAKNIYDSNERLIALVDSLLNISRIESGRLIIDPKPTDLKKLVEEVVAELKPKFLEKKQTPIINVHQKLPLINIDPKLIRHVYINLLTNASKYSPKNSEISVFVSKKDDKIISQVSDNGYGIPQKDQFKVFQKFYRGENIIKLEADGTGLGLYLVKAIIDSSGGKIWFKSQENKGTTFWFSLPLSGSPVQKGQVSIDS